MLKVIILLKLKLQIKFNILNFITIPMLFFIQLFFHITNKTIFFIQFGWTEQHCEFYLHKLNNFNYSNILHI